MQGARDAHVRVRESLGGDPRRAKNGKRVVLSRERFFLHPKAQTQALLSAGHNPDSQGVGSGKTLSPEMPKFQDRHLSRLGLKPYGSHVKRLALERLRFLR